MSSLVSNKLFLASVGIVVMVGIVFSFPTILEINVEHAERRQFTAMQEVFPITVDPANKTIVEDDTVNAFLESADSPLQAATWNVGNAFGRVFAFVAIAISEAPWYRALAAADGRFVDITPGMRREQVANAFARALGWNEKQKKEFLTVSPYSSLPLSEGSFLEGIYLVDNNMPPAQAQALVNKRFSDEILSHYPQETAQIVPLSQALTIASLIEREAGGADDMRIISGIIWNRLFINMRLQIDATLQYAKASARTNANWWPAVVPNDRFRKSAYNTYANVGLPPTPIASPSVASVLAALNPKKTNCLFYFHDSNRGFHCTETYAEHVALLKQYYGRGK